MGPTTCSHVSQTSIPTDFFHRKGALHSEQSDRRSSKLTEQYGSIRRSHDSRWREPARIASGEILRCSVSMSHTLRWVARSPTRLASALGNMVDIVRDNTSSTGQPMMGARRSSVAESSRVRYPGRSMLMPARRSTLFRSSSTWSAVARATSPTRLSYSSGTVGKRSGWPIFILRSGTLHPDACRCGRFTLRRRIRRPGGKALRLRTPLGPRFLVSQPDPQSNATSVVEDTRLLSGFLTR